mgnify:CR=1 FL=1
MERHHRCGEILCACGWPLILEFVGQHPQSIKYLASWLCSAACLHGRHTAPGVLHCLTAQQPLITEVSEKERESSLFRSQAHHQSCSSSYLPLTPATFKPKCYQYPSVLLTNRTGSNRTAQPSISRGDLAVLLAAACAVWSCGHPKRTHPGAQMDWGVETGTAGQQAQHSTARHGTAG